MTEQELAKLLKDNGWTFHARRKYNARYLYAEKVLERKPAGFKIVGDKRVHKYTVKSQSKYIATDNTIKDMTESDVLKKLKP